MIVEVGMPFSDPVTSQSFLADIINKTKSLAGGNGPRRFLLGAGML